MADKYLLIDGHSILSRAYYGIPMLTNSKGVHTNAVYGFLNIMLKAIEDEQANHLAVAFDLDRKKLLRTQRFPAYKGTRKPMPEELHEQVPLIQQMLTAMGIPILTKVGYESDDILGTIARRAAETGAEVTILSGDRDLLQLAAPQVKISIPKTSRGHTEVFQYYPDDVKAEYGVTPKEYIDVKGLMGDTSDNIPGVHGIGEKTAFPLIQKYGSIEELQAHLSEVTPPGVRKKLEADFPMAVLSKDLATIDTQVPIDFELKAAQIENPYTEAALELCRSFEFKSLIERFAKGLDGQSKAGQESSTLLQLPYLRIVRDRALAKVIFRDALRERTLGLRCFFEKAESGTSETGTSEAGKAKGLHGDFAALGLCLAKDRCYAVLSSKAYPAEELLDDVSVLAAKLREAGVKVYTTNLKEQLKVLGLPRNADWFDLSVAAYVLNPLKDSYANEDLARDYLGVQAESRAELLGKRSLSQAAALPETETFTGTSAELDAPDDAAEARSATDAADVTAADGSEEASGDVAVDAEAGKPHGESDKKKNQRGADLETLLLAERNAAMHFSSRPAETALSKKAAAYIGLSAYIPYYAAQPMRKALKESGSLKLYEDIEEPLIYSLNDMETAGICVDRASLDAYAEQLSGQIHALEQQIYEESGEVFNINSPSQLGQILFERLGLKGGKKTKTKGYSTAAKELNKLAEEHPIVRHVLRYRELTKLYSTYAAGLTAYIQEDGRIHGTFQQTVTATGRISSTDPNLQNIPVRTAEGKEIRKVFVPAKGFVFVDADYSQVELRILAALSGDERLISAYRDAVDIHSLTASEVFHVPLDEVTPEMRRNAKAVNFGIVYGISAFGLGEGLSISQKEAKAYIEKYFETYPKVKTFLDAQVAQAKESGIVRTAFGRIRPVPEIKSSAYMTRQFGERIAMNSPIQGTAADVMKRAMNGVNLELAGLDKNGKSVGKAYRSRIVLQVHDELLIETAPEEVEAVMALVRRQMEQASAGAKQLSAVKLSVDVRAGENWYACH